MLEREKLMSNVVALNSRQEVLNNLGGYGKADFNVYTRPVFFQADEGLSRIPNKLALVRDDNIESLGVVSDSYQIAQHPDAFRTVERIIADSELDLTGVERTISVSHGGARAYAIYSLPAHTIETDKGDPSALQISARNSFDGSWCFHVDIGSVRMICTNGQVFIEDFAMFKSKHTRGLNMAHAARKLSNAVEVYANEVERWKEWKQTGVTSARAFMIFGKVANCKAINSFHTTNPLDLLEEPEIYRNKTLVRLWDHYRANERKALGSNLWAVYNTVTHWATHTPATKSTAQKNIAAIKVKRQDTVRSVFKELALAA
jgi:hypothetical protein